MGERVVRNDEVGSSILPGSTKCKGPDNLRAFFLPDEFPLKSARHARLAATGSQPLIAPKGARAMRRMALCGIALRIACNVPAAESVS